MLVNFEFCGKRQRIVDTGPEAIDRFDGCLGSHKLDIINDSILVGSNA